MSKTISRMLTPIVSEVHAVGADTHSTVDRLSDLGLLHSGRAKDDGCGEPNPGAETSEFGKDKPEFSIPALSTTRWEDLGELGVFEGHLRAACNDAVSSRCNHIM
jgi:hypothetical protein